MVKPLSDLECTDIVFCNIPISSRFEIEGGIGKVDMHKVEEDFTNELYLAMFGTRAVIRRGKWTVEEENYALKLLTEFSAAIIPLSEGITLRTFLARMLNCDPMRISKKYVGHNSIGKQVYKRRDDAVSAPSDYLYLCRREMAVLERRFVDRVSRNGSSNYSRPKPAPAAAPSHKHARTSGLRKHDHGDDDEYDDDDDEAASEEKEKDPDLTTFFSNGNSRKRNRDATRQSSRNSSRSRKVYTEDEDSGVESGSASHLYLRQSHGTIPRVTTLDRLASLPIVMPSDALNGGGDGYDRIPGMRPRSDTAFSFNAAGEGADGTAGEGSGTLRWTMSSRNSFSSMLEWAGVIDAKTPISLRKMHPPHGAIPLAQAQPLPPSPRQQQQQEEEEERTSAAGAAKEEETDSEHNSTVSSSRHTKGSSQRRPFQSSSSDKDQSGPNTSRSSSTSSSISSGKSGAAPAAQTGGGIMLCPGVGFPVGMGRTCSVENFWFVFSFSQVRAPRSSFSPTHSFFCPPPLSHLAGCLSIVVTCQSLMVTCSVSCSRPR